MPKKDAMTTMRTTDLSVLKAKLVIGVGYGNQQKNTVYANNENLDAAVLAKVALRERGGKAVQRPHPSRNRFSKQEFT